MTIAEAELFYQMDNEKYNVSINKEFLKWYSKQLKNGYSSYMGISEMQNLIDNIVSWYEIKYPERQLQYYEGIKHYNFQNIKFISKSLNFEQLMFRLSHNQLSLIQCYYRAKGYSYPDKIFMKVVVEDFKSLPNEIISANYKTGIVTRIGFGRLKLDCDNEMTLDDLLKLLENMDKKIDLKELKECINNHNVDLELRKKLLQLAALELLYSKNTIPERGYERARRFINEFNKHIPNLNLSISEIDEIMQINYKEESEKLRNAFNFKRLLKKY